MIRVAIVEDHPAIGAGLKALLGDETDLEVVDVVNDAAEAEKLVDSGTPDVVLCDVMLAGQDAGLDLLRRFADARTSFIMFSAYAHPAMYRSALDGGAAGFLHKTALIPEIVGAIRTVSAGGRVFPEAALQGAQNARPRPSPADLEAIRLLGRGATNRDIAQARSITIKTVESQIRRLFDRYDVGNRTELVRLAQSEGWLMGDRG